MAKVLILGGGFGGVAAAESLAKKLAPEHHITLVSRSEHSVFHPSLVRLAFGEYTTEDISFDLRKAMINSRIRFVQGEVARVDPYKRRVAIAHGERQGEMYYDYLVFALGGRLATERITGFFEHAHHPLSVEAALKFGEAIRSFKEGRAVIGYSPEARLAAPVYETAFALSRLLEDRGDRGRTQITVVSPEPSNDELAGSEMGQTLREALNTHRIDFLPDFPISHVTARSVLTSRGDQLDYDLLMLLPPFQGAPAVRGMRITDQDGFIRVDKTMRVLGVERMYAVGDCVNFPGAKMGHMAELQGDVAAANLVAEVEAREPEAKYEHEMIPVADQGARDSLYQHKPVLADGKASLKQGRAAEWQIGDPGRALTPELREIIQ